jgi:hypothetical protein
MLTVQITMETLVAQVVLKQDILMIGQNVHSKPSFKMVLIQINGNQSMKDLVESCVLIKLIIQVINNLLLSQLSVANMIVLLDFYTTGMAKVFNLLTLLKLINLSKLLSSLFKSKLWIMIPILGA